MASFNTLTILIVVALTVANTLETYDLFEFVTVNNSCSYTQINSKIDKKQTFNISNAAIFSDLVQDCSIYSSRYINNPYFLFNDVCIFNSTLCSGNNCPQCMCNSTGIITYGSIQTLTSSDCYKCNCTSDSNGNYQSCTLLKQYDRNFDTAECPPKMCTYKSVDYSINDVWWDSSINCEYCTCISTSTMPVVFCSTNITTIYSAYNSPENITNATVTNLLKACPSLDSCRTDINLWYFQENECGCPVCDCPSSKNIGSTWYTSYIEDNVYKCQKCACFNSTGNGVHSLQAGCSHIMQSYDNTCSGMECYVENALSTFMNYMNGNETIDLSFASHSVGCQQQSCGTMNIMNYDVNMNVIKKYGCMDDWLCYGLLPNDTCIERNVNVSGYYVDCESMDNIQSLSWSKSYNATVECCSGHLCNNETFNLECKSNIFQDAMKYVFEMYPTCVYNQYNAISAFGIHEYCGDKVRITDYYSRCDYIRDRGIAELGCICSVYNTSNVSDITYYKQWFQSKYQPIMNQINTFSCSNMFQCLWTNSYLEVKQKYYILSFEVINGNKGLLRNMIANDMNIARNSVNIINNDTNCTVNIHFDYEYESNDFYANRNETAYKYGNKWGDGVLNFMQSTNDITKYYMEGKDVSDMYVPPPTAAPTIRTTFPDPTSGPTAAPTNDGVRYGSLYGILVFLVVHIIFFFR